MRRGSRSSSSAGRRTPTVAEPTLAAIERHLTERERRRETLFERARRLRRLSRTAIAHLHAGAPTDRTVAPIRRELAALQAAVDAGGAADESVALDALQEAAEASLLAAVVDGGPVPGPRELGVAPEPYLLGLADTVGELRRRALDRLRRDDVAGAEAELATMEALTEALLRFDTARAIVQLKPKQDTARALVERTRGDVVLARALARANARGGRRR